MRKTKMKYLKDVKRIVEEKGGNKNEFYKVFEIKCVKNVKMV